MKVKQFLMVCGTVAAMCLAASSLMAQDENAGGQGGGRRRGNGGGGGFGGGGGNFDPAQFQQQRMDRYREDLGFTNDTDWNAVQPLIQKVMEAQTAAFAGGRGGGRRGNGGGGNGGGGGGRGGFGQPNPEQEALQKAIDDNAPTAQIKEALAKYRSSRKEKQAKLEAAQNELKKVLSVKQEAQAALIGLVQ